jgi:non-ribosomal peptide synthetase component F
VEPSLVSMDTSLLSVGLLIARFASTDSSRRDLPTCSVESSVMDCYRVECSNKCYACKLDAEISKIDPCPENGCPDGGRPVSTCPTNIAYILSTSGTTGRPRVVKVPHCCIVPNIVDLRSRFKITPDDVIFNASPLTFDPCFVEV